MPRPDGFTASKDAYAEWLGEVLASFDDPADVVGHDIGALLALRVASDFDVPLRSWTVDVANIFHPSLVWPERMHQLQSPGVGQEILETERTISAEDPRSTTSRLAAHRSVLGSARSGESDVVGGWPSASAGRRHCGVLGFVDWNRPIQAGELEDVAVVLVQPAGQQSLAACSGAH